MTHRNRIMTSSQQKMLHLCSRISGHTEQRLQLCELSVSFSKWEQLLGVAELEGITPLLYKHLVESESIVPTDIRRSLGVVVARHKRYTEIRNNVLLEVLQRLGQEGIQVLVLKGAALCHTLYPDPFLRPMRDIDILLDEKNADTGQAILKEYDYIESTSPIPADHFHLPPLLKSIDKLKVWVEIHRGLFPKCSPFYPKLDFPGLMKNSRNFSIDGFGANTFGDEDMLWYLYQHGFRAPLPYEGYRLINVADLIGMVEEKRGEMHWKTLRHKYPRMCTALPLMHHLSPWNPEVIESDLFPQGEINIKRTSKQFQGWPKKKIKTYKREGSGLLKILLETFFPPIWWLKIYYGIATPFGCVICLFTSHPKNVFWWVKLHSFHLNSPEKEGIKVSEASAGNRSLILFRIRSIFIKLLK